MASSHLNNKVNSWPCFSMHKAQTLTDKKNIARLGSYISCIPKLTLFIKVSIERDRMYCDLDGVIPILILSFIQQADCQVCWCEIYHYR